jgi:hypothetical protein
MASTPAPTLRRLKVLVCAQNEWYTQPIPATCSARAGVDSVISIGGAVFLPVGTPKTPDLPAFGSTRQEDVEARIRNWLINHDDPKVSDDTTGIIIMDIEDPHPRDLGDVEKVPSSLVDRVIDGFATRAAAARTVFRKAKLGFFATLVPDGQGRATPEYKVRRAALVRAGKRGMFDSVNCLFPVVYPRFGPTDGKAWDSYATYTRQGIRGSRKLLKSDGSSLSVVPLTTCWVANSPQTSNHDHQVLLDLPTPDPLDKTLGVQLDVMIEEGVRTAVVWVGENSDVITNKKVKNPNGRTVSQHICFRGPKPDVVLAARKR